MTQADTLKGFPQLRHLIILLRFLLLLLLLHFLELLGLQFVKISGFFRLLLLLKGVARGANGPRLKEESS